MWLGARPDSGGGWNAPPTRKIDVGIITCWWAVRRELILTIRILGHVTRLVVDHSFDECRERWIRGEESEVGRELKKRKWDHIAGDRTYKHTWLAVSRSH